MTPRATKVFWQELQRAPTAVAKIAETLIFRFGAAHEGALWNFETAKTRVFYCGWD